MQSTVALRYTKFAVKMLLGALFLVSALTKLIDIDKFELYVYSFDILSLGLSYIAARLVIGFEFLLGIALSVNIYNKYTIRLTLLTLMVFTLFLVYAVLIGRTDNCHCFGEFVAFDPIESIIKNIVFIIATLFCCNVKEYKFRPRWYILLPVVLLTFATVFIVSPPDNMVSYPTATKYSINEELFNEYIQPNGPLDTLGIAEDKKLVAFYSPNCKYCKLSARKMETMQHRMNIDTSSIITVFGGETTNLDKFYKETDTKPTLSMFMEVDNFLPLTRGRFPVVVLLDNGTIIHAFQYRSIDEGVIKDFFIGNTDL